jgi:DNA (cytosine-5)-methyltransferase 1
MDNRSLLHRPKLLDLFCCAGGAAKGYHDGGYDVVGVDKDSQPNYPFDFVQMDALELLVDLVEGKSTWTSRQGRQFFLSHFEAIHASPPCQHFTKYRNVHKDITDRYDDLVAPTRELLKLTGLPWVMENVEGSPLIDPVTLCGRMFDLDVRRHRLFETNWALQPPAWPCRHKIWGPRYKSATGRRKDSRLTIEVGSWDEPLELQKKAMGVDWTITTRELSEAIPPAYTEYIGHQLLAHINAMRTELADAA